MTTKASGRVEIVASLEESGQRVVLRRRGEFYDVLLGQVVLLSSAALETELRFGHLAREAPGGADKRVLVGGLGFGATAAGVLEGEGGAKEVLVAEKLAALPRLLREFRPGPHAALVDDPRVLVRLGDVTDEIAAAAAAGGEKLDAILLDVDNGPGWASFRTNARIYGAEGLRLAHEALTPGGLFAVWSGYPADAFLGRLRSAGFVASVVPLLERGVVRARAYVGRKPP